MKKQILWKSKVLNWQLPFASLKAFRSINRYEIILLQKFWHNKNNWILFQSEVAFPNQEWHYNKNYVTNTWTIL